MLYECVLLYQIIFVHFSCNSCLVLSRTFVISKIFNPSSQIICIVCQEAEKYDFCCIVVKTLTVMEIFKFSLAAATVELNRNEGLNCIFFLKIVTIQVEVQVSPSQESKSSSSLSPSQESKSKSKSKYKSRVQV